MLAKAVFHTETISVTTEGGGGKWGNCPQPPPDPILIFVQIRREMFFEKMGGGGRALTLPWKSHHLLNGQAAVF